MLRSAYANRISRRFISVLLLGWLATAIPFATAQEPAPQANPSDFGLQIPVGQPVRQGEGRRVIVVRDGKQFVANVHVEVGDRRILLMPNGRLESIPVSETRPTDKPFVPATFDEMSSELLSGTFKGFKTRKTARYLYIYNSSEDFFKATSRILETMYPPVVAYFKRYKFEVHDPETPLVVIMFRTEDEFQKYHEMPSGVVAYYTAILNHVVMYEQSKLVEVAPELAVSQSIATIAHEGIHQILHNIGVQQRLARWPIWVSEGLAEYFAPTEAGKRLRWKGVGVVNDMRMYELERFLKQPSKERGALVSHTAAAPNLTSTGYAAAWALTHYLAQRKPEKFHAMVNEISHSKPFEEGVQPGEQASVMSKNRELFSKYFGTDFVSMEDDLVKYLQKLPYTNPIINQTHYVVMITVANGALIQRMAGVTSSPAAVMKYQQEALENVPPSARAGASMRIVPYPNKGAAEQAANQWLRSN